MGQITANAFTWGYFRISGGLRSSITLALAYLVGGIALIGLIIANDPRQTTPVMSGVCHVALGLQLLILGGIVCLTITNNVQRDTTTKMLESHRLMPVPPHLAILGYVFGSAKGALPVALVNLVVGGIAASAAGLPSQWWLIANAVIFGFCILMWCITAAGAFSGVLLGMIVTMPFGVVVLSKGMAGVALPGLLMLSSPVLGKSVFSAQPYDAETVLPLVLSTLLQAAMASVVVVGAGRRYRSGDLPAFPGGLGVLLVFVFAVASLLAMVTDNVLPPHSSDRMKETGIVSSIMAMLVLGSLVISSTVSDYLLDRRRHMPAGRRTSREAMVVGGILACILLLVLFAPGELPRGGKVLWTLAACSLFLVTVLLWVRWAYRFYISVVVISLIVTVMAILPPIFSLFLRDDAGDLTREGQWVCQISVFAALPALWREAGDFHTTVLLPQLVLMLIPAALLWLHKGKGNVG